MQQVQGKTLWDRAERAGALRSRREILRIQLEDKFGPIPEALVQKIDAVTDPDQLTAALRQVVRINTLSELQL